jgi:hypothetical protein
MLTAMTYSFDTNKWYDNELFMIQIKLKKDELTQKEYDLAVLELDQKMEEMWKRCGSDWMEVIR